jgi:ferrous iron transport protein B
LKCQTTNYRCSIAINVIEKLKLSFFGAGKIILAISIVLWFMASYGPLKKE